MVEHRVRLLRAAGRVELGLARSCRRRRTPTPPSCCARKAPRVVAHLAALHGVIHALPLTYNKDLQEDKEYLFDAVDTIELALRRRAACSPASRFDATRMARAAADEMIAATDIADLLVELGVPFREAHGVVAGLVRAPSSAAPDALAAHRRGDRGREPAAGRRPRGCAPCSPRALAGVEGLAGRDRRGAAGASSSRWPRRCSMAVAAS